MVRLTTELAGLGGDVGFIKNDIKLESFYSLYEDIVRDLKKYICCVNKYLNFKIGIKINSRLPNLKY